MKHWKGVMLISLLLVVLLLPGCKSDTAIREESTDGTEQKPTEVAGKADEAEDEKPEATEDEVKAEDEEEYAWVLVDTSTWANSASGAPSGDWSPEETRQLEDELFMYHELTGPHDYVQYYARVSDMLIEYRAEQLRKDPPGVVHVIYTWTAPPSIIKDMETVAIVLSQEVMSNYTDNYYVSRLLSCQARVDTRDLSGTRGITYFQGTFPDGSAAQTGGRGALSNSYEHDSYKHEVSSIELSVAFGRENIAAKEGERRSIEVKILTRKEIGTRYTYEYKNIR